MKVQFSNFIWMWQDGLYKQNDTQIAINVFIAIKEHQI
jgi:hypothetical protein